MIWYVGDSAIESAVVEFAGDEQVLNSTSPNASPEEVWTIQKHDSRRRWQSPVTVILYLPQKDYDSEVTLWHLLAAVPLGSKIIYCYTPDSPSVVEGLNHYDNPIIHPVELQSTDHSHVLAKLRAA